MSTRWSASPRIHLGIVLVAYAALAVAVQVHCSEWLTSDGECYLRMAAYYARGDLRHAVFGHWSPLAAWLTTPLVAAGMLPRVAFRLMIGLWGALAVVGVWRLAGRFPMSVWHRGAVTVCGALMVAEFSAAHRIDLLLTALLLLYLDAVMDERLLQSWPWAAWVGILGGAAYLAKLYAAPFFAVHFPLVVAARAWAARGGCSSQTLSYAEEASSPESSRYRTQARRSKVWRQAALALAAGFATFAVVTAPWVAVLSMKYGRLTLGTAAATSYALVGPGSGTARRDAILGLRRPPADSYNVWQDATLDAMGPRRRVASPLSSGQALARQLRVAWRNAGRILGHLAKVDEFLLAPASLGLTPLLLVLTRRRRGLVLGYLTVVLTVVVFCGGYAFIQAANPRYFWFVFLVLTVLAFHVAAVLPPALGRSLRGRRRRLLTVAVGVVAVVSFGFHPVRALLTNLVWEPPPGRQHLLVAQRLAELGATGPLACIGPDGWWDGLHTAYYLGAKYAGVPTAKRATEIVAEMRDAGAKTLLVWRSAAAQERAREPLVRDIPRVLAELLREPALERVAEIPTGSLTSLTQHVTVFRLRDRR